MGRITDALRKMEEPEDNSQKEGDQGKSRRDSIAFEKDVFKKDSEEKKIVDSAKVSGDLNFPKILFGEVSPEVFVYYEDIFPEGVEEVKHICSSLLKLPERVFLFTSAQPSEGKTLLCINLGMALGKYFSKNVLYVDADLRAPDSSLSYLDLPERRLVGFSDVLNGEARIESAILSTEVDGLYLMPRGKRIALNKIAPDTVSNVFFYLKDKFDFVFVDVPPVRAFSDSVLMAQNVEGVIMVVRMNRTSRGSVKHAVQILKDSLSVPIYFVLNAVSDYIPGKKASLYSYYYK